MRVLRRRRRREDCTACCCERLVMSYHSPSANTSYLLSLTRNYYQCQDELCDLMMGWMRRSSSSPIIKCGAPPNKRYTDEMCVFCSLCGAAKKRRFCGAGCSLACHLPCFSTSILRGRIVNMSFNKKLTRQPQIGLFPRYGGSVHRGLSWDEGGNDLHVVAVAAAAVL